MAINEAELTHVVDALQSVVGAPFNGAWQPTRDRVILQFGTRFLLMVPRGPHARIHSVGRRPRNPKRPFSFQGALRSHLGGRLTAIRKVPGDRIVELELDRGALHLRLTGRRGGLWLLDGPEVVAAYDGPAPAALPPVAPRPPRDTAPRFRPTEGQDWDRAAADWLGQAERADRLRQLRIRVERDLRRARDRHQRLLQNLERDLDKASRAPLLRRQADALAARLHEIPRGARAAVVEDLEEAGRSWTVELDPSKPASAAMEKLYRQARRLDRAGDHVLERIDQVEARLAALTGAVAEVPDADLDRLRELDKLAPKAHGGAGVDAPAPFVRWLGPHGEVVLVGRNARSNRQLTFQTAKGWDWWMHLRGIPGAHLVLRSQRDGAPSLEVLLAMAQIALVHGKVPEGSARDVQYTRVRDVRSIPGAADGRVRLANEKVLHVTRDASALDGWTRGA